MFESLVTGMLVVKSKNLAPSKFAVPEVGSEVGWSQNGSFYVKFGPVWTSGQTGRENRGQSGHCGAGLVATASYRP